MLCLHIWLFFLYMNMRTGVYNKVLIRLCFCLNYKWKWTTTEECASNREKSYWNIFLTAQWVRKVIRKRFCSNGHLEKVKLLKIKVFIGLLNLSNSEWRISHDAIRNPSSHFLPPDFINNPDDTCFCSHLAWLYKNVFNWKKHSLNSIKCPFNLNLHATLFQFQYLD